MLVTRIEFGSHLYGTNTETSDHDYKSVHLPTAQEILLQRVRNSTGHEVIRPEGEKNTPDDVDDESYSLQRYLQLLAEGQTVAIDMLFAPTQIVYTPLWGYIKENKDRFLTKKTASYLGYCRQQANKYGIKGSRVAAAKEAMEFFGEYYEKNPHAKVHECFVPGIDNLTLGLHSRIYTKETTQGHFETYFECCNRSVGYKNTVKEAYGIFTRIYQEYGKRARMAEQNDGVDFKALSHAVRVGHEAIELLRTGNVTFPLPNKEHVLAIKLGKFTYKEVAQEIDDLLVRVEEESEKSSLRDEPDYNFIDLLVCDTYGAVVYKQQVKGYK